MADVVIYRKEKALIRVQVLDKNGDPKNLTGTTVAFRIGSRRYNVFRLAKAGALSNNGADGLIEAELTASETESVPRMEWDFQFIVTDSGGDPQVMKEGKIDVRNMLPES